MLYLSNNFASGFICALLLLAWVGLVRWSQKKVAPFWNPDNPHLNPKPSPFTILQGCLMGYAALIVTIVVGTLVAVWLYSNWG